MVETGIFRKRPFFFPAVFLSLGAFGGTDAPYHVFFYVASAGVLLFGAWVLRNYSGSHLLLLSACFLAGLGLAAWEMGPAYSFPKAVRLEGIVQEVSHFEQTTRLTLAVTKVNDEAVDVRTQLHSSSILTNVLPGQFIRVPARWSRIREPGNPGEFNQASWRKRKGIHYTGSFDSRTLVSITPAPGLSRWMNAQHQSLAKQATGVAPSPQAAALYLTLAAGMRASLGPQLEEEFSASGLAHVLSVSGLHVAVLAMVVLFGLRWVLVRVFPWGRIFDVRRIAAPLSIPTIWAYVFFTGNQGPAVRSAIMISIVMLGYTLWRRTDALNALAMAALLSVAFEPSCVADLSMQLSFSAVLSLLLFTRAIRHWFPERSAPQGSEVRYWLGRFRESILTTFCASLAVTLGSAPLVASAFGKISLAGLLSNVVCLPLSGLLTFLAAGGAALHCLHPAFSWPVVALGTHLSQLVLYISHFFAVMPGAVWASQSFGLGLALSYWVGLYFGLLGSGQWKWLGSWVPVTIACSFLPPHFFRPPESTVTFLSVGQGDSIVLSSRGHHAIIDGGGVPGGTDTGKRYVLPFLKHEGIQSFDLAVLSHPHPDHALGLISTLQEIPARRLWLAAGSSQGALSNQLVLAAHGGSLADDPLQTEEVEKGHAPLKLGDFEIEVLGPPQDRALVEGVNDNSVVLRVTHHQVSFLLTGDIEAAGEELLGVTPVTVLKAPHHGSKTSSGEHFLKKTQPRFVVFCVGQDNRFHFPHSPVVDRYLASGAQCFRTDEHGAIQFQSDGTFVHVKTFKKVPVPQPVSP